MSSSGIESSSSASAPTCTKDDYGPTRRSVSFSFPLSSSVGSAVGVHAYPREPSFPRPKAGHTPATYIPPSQAFSLHRESLPAPVDGHITGSLHAIDPVDDAQYLRPSVHTHPQAGTLGGPMNRRRGCSIHLRFSRLSLLLDRSILALSRTFKTLLALSLLRRAFSCQRSVVPSRLSTTTSLCTAIKHGRCLQKSLTRMSARRSC